MPATVTDITAIIPNQAPTAAAIEIKNLWKIYPNGTKAVNNVNLAINKSDFIAIIGSSGAGKSSLLRMINRLNQPTKGQIFLFGQDITKINGSSIRDIRHKVGMIFQQFHLVRRLSVLENVLIGRLKFTKNPLKKIQSICRIFPKKEQQIAFDCLRQVGIEKVTFQRADTLSGGQQQRVAIARTLAQEPDVFLADEPIASLDPHSAETVMNILKEIHKKRNMPVIVNLHHIDFARRYANRIIGMKSGKVVFDGSAQDLTPEAIETIYGAKINEAFGEEDTTFLKCA